MHTVSNVGRLSRRIFLGGGSALLLSACVGGVEESEDYRASAAKGDARYKFVDTLAWLSAPNSFSIAFLPYRLEDLERQDVLASQTLYPTLSRQMPMLHMKVETGGSELQAASVRSVELVFWHFDALPTVVRDEVAGNADTVMSLTNLSGSVRKGGFAIGTLRGQKVVESKTMERPASFTWNLDFQVSII